MFTTLHYSVNTFAGDKLDFEFPLHPETQSAVRVRQLLTAMLASLDHELRALGESANGDVMQALAMALAVRTAMLHAPYEIGRDLSAELVANSLTAAEDCVRQPGMVGHA